MWTGCCPVTSLGALTYLGRWQLLPLLWNRFLAFLERRAVSTSFSTNKQEPCDLTGTFFCKACFWACSKCFLSIHSLLRTGKCGTHGSVSVSEMCWHFMLALQRFSSCDLFKTQFWWNMYQTLLADSQIHTCMENARNATSHPVCWKKLSSLQIFLWNKKGSAIPKILLLHYNRTPLSCLLTKEEKGLDVEEDQMRCCSHLALWGIPAEGNLWGC